MSIQGTSVEILDATLCTRTLVGEDFSTKPKTKQPPSEATEAEAHEGSEAVVEVTCARAMVPSGNGARSGLAGHGGYREP